jgi:hypothetical protein
MKASEEAVELANLSESLTQDKDKEKKKESKSIFEQWVWLSIGAMLFFATSDFIVSLYGHMGVKLLMYYNVGPLFGCLIYYLG